jgi:hypothetical protein
MQGMKNMTKPIHRLADYPIPGSLNLKGMPYVQVSISEEYSTGKFIVKVGDLQSKPFFTLEQAKREFCRLSSLELITRRDIDGYY